MQIIFDVGSGASLPDKDAATKVVDAIAPFAQLFEGEVVLKAQLFKHIPPNQPLKPSVFEHLWDYGKLNNLKVTSSVFDRWSLQYLLGMDPPFVKIACRPDLYHLAGEIPRKVPVYVSYDCRNGSAFMNDLPAKIDVGLACVPQYPALLKEYNYSSATTGFSDHTLGLELWNRVKYKAEHFEKHFVLVKGDTSNPDSMGGFALGPEDLKDLL